MSVSLKSIANYGSSGKRGTGHIKSGQISWERTEKDLVRSAVKENMQGRRVEMTVKKKKVAEGKEDTKNLLEAETDIIFGFTLKSVWKI